MPFKTRRRKQSAAERRFTWTQNQAVRYEGVGQSAFINSHESLGKTKVSDGKRITETVNTRADLIKIVLAASVIVAVQVILSLTLR